MTQHYLMDQKYGNTQQLASHKTLSSQFFLKSTDRNKAATIASYRVSQIIAKKKKPYEDCEMIKEAFLEAADVLFDNFKNKSDIISAIKSTQLSANTVTRRI